MLENLNSGARIMKMQRSVTVVSLIAISFFVALPFGLANAEQPVVASDHVQLAKHHEVLLKEAETKLEEHRVALEDYESSSQYYGRRGQDFRSHEIANIREYEKEVAEHRAQAALHYQLAADENKSLIFASGIRVP